MIKLKTLIKEIQSDLSLSKMEEEYAFRIMLKKLVPWITKVYNIWIDKKTEYENSRRKVGFKRKFHHTDVKEMSDNIRKINREPNKVEYDCILRSGHVRFIIIKDIEPFENKEEITIGHTSPTELGWEDASGITWYNISDLLKKK